MVNFPFASAIEPWMLALVFVVTFIGTLIFVPWAIVRLPADYFRNRTHQSPLLQSLHPVLRVVLIVGKNLLGLLLVLAGMTMLILPGQGLLTILIGIVLIDFPGKFQAEFWLVKRRPVRRSVNWLRKIRHKPPFELD